MTNRDALREALLRIFDASEARPDIRDIARAALAASPAVSITDDPDYYPNTDYERGYADGFAALTASSTGSRSREEADMTKADGSLRARDALTDTQREQFVDRIYTATTWTRAVSQETVAEIVDDIASAALAASPADGEGVDVPTLAAAMRVSEAPERVAAEYARLRATEQGAERMEEGRFEAGGMTGPDGKWGIGPHVARQARAGWMCRAATERAGGKE